MKKNLGLLAIAFVITAITSQARAQADDEAPTSVYVQSVKS